MEGAGGIFPKVQKLYGFKKREASRLSSSPSSRDHRTQQTLCAAKDSPSSQPFKLRRPASSISGEQLCLPFSCLSDRTALLLVDHLLPRRTPTGSISFLRFPVATGDCLLPAATASRPRTPSPPFILVNFGSYKSRGSHLPPFFRSLPSTRTSTIAGIEDSSGAGRELPSYYLLLRCLNRFGESPLLSFRSCMFRVLFLVFRRPQPPPATVAMVAAGGDLCVVPLLLLDQALMDLIL